MTNDNPYSQKMAQNSRDNGQNAAGNSNTQNQSNSQNTKKKRDYANVYIRVGEYEISLEANESLEDTTDCAIHALTRAKAVDNLQDMPTKGVQ